MLQDNLKKTAVALEYEKGDMAPKVIASGRGYIADRIIKTAEERFRFIRMKNWRKVCRC